MLKNIKLKYNIMIPYAFLAPAIALLRLTVFFPAIRAFALSFASYEIVLITKI